MLSVHVDDQLTACNSRSALDAFKHTLNNKFECSDSGPAGYFLGFSIYRDRPARKLHSSQQHYLEAILDRFDLVDCNPARSPLPYGFRPIPATDEEHQAARHRAYPQAVGAILYASTVSRPDLSRAASVLSRFISKWNETGKQPNTCFATSAAHPTSVLPLRQNLVTELPWVMQMHTEGVTWTLNALLGLWRHCCVEKPASANLCFVYYRSRVHGISRCSTTGYLGFRLMIFSLVLATNLSPS